MRGLQLRLKRLEERFRKKKTGAPSQHEFLEANARQQVRRVYNAKSRLAGEEWAWDRLSESDGEVLRNDTEEQRRKDEDVEERWRRVHGPGEERISGVAARVRQKLRAMTRVAVGRPE